MWVAKTVHLEYLITLKLIEITRNHDSLLVAVFVDQIRLHKLQKTRTLPLSTSKEEEAC